MSGEKQTTPRRLIAGAAMPGLSLALAAATAMAGPRVADYPPEPKKRNPKRARQAAQRKARKIQRRAQA